MTCAFCTEPASWAARRSDGLTTYGPATLAFCRWHLLRYYLSMWP